MSLLVLVPVVILYNTNIIGDLLAAHFFPNRVTKFSNKSHSASVKTGFKVSQRK